MAKRGTKCPAEVTLAVLGGRWKVLILFRLFQGVKRFSQLQRSVKGITQKVLTQQLRELVGDGLVQRQPRGAIPSPVEYSLTDYGQSVLPLVEGIRLWGRNHIERLSAQTDVPPSDSRMVKAEHRKDLEGR